jgi:hypothetical protein
LTEVKKKTSRIDKSKKKKTSRIDKSKNL